MREIKFRAWDGETFYYIDLNEKLNDICESYFEMFWKLEKEQFTGLKDKNGVEIFEGDILQDFRKTFKYKCEFRENGAFEFQNITTLNYALLHEIHKAEVIGNIHQNKDLLNEQ